MEWLSSFQKPMYPKNKILRRRSLGPIIKQKWYFNLSLLSALYLFTIINEDAETNTLRR